MKINTIDKIYIVSELKQRGIIVQLEELDQLKDELLPFAKARLQYKQQNGGITEQEQSYAQKMAKYFGIE